MRDTQGTGDGIERMNKNDVDNDSVATRRCGGRRMLSIIDGTAAVGRRVAGGETRQGITNQRKGEGRVKDGGVRMVEESGDEDQTNAARSTAMCAPALRASRYAANEFAFIANVVLRGRRSVCWTTS